MKISNEILLFFEKYNIFNNIMNYTKYIAKFDYIYLIKQVKLFLVNIFCQICQNLTYFLITQILF